MTTPFTSYAFTTTGGSASRILPERLIEIVNVKDFGAIGNGTADDGPAIASAIAYVEGTGGIGNMYWGGAIIYFPAGTYYIANPPLTISPSPPYAAPNGVYFIYAGAGRDATKITGYLANGNPSESDTPSFVVRSYGRVQVIRDMTIENTATAVRSGALMIAGSGDHEYYVNLRLRGVVGNSNMMSFGCLYENCIFECIRPITVASDASRSPNFQYTNFGHPVGGVSQLFGSVGIYISGGTLVNCQFTGFDIGVTGRQASVTGCYFSRCGVGIFGALTDGQPIGEVGYPLPGDLAIWNAVPCMSNRFDRCTMAINCYQAQSITIAANSIIGTTGPTEPATIASITKSDGNAVVTTTDDHNLPVTAIDLVLVTDPATWTPDNSGDQIVSCTKTGARTFTYALTASPGSFTSGSWNYPINCGIACRIVQQMSFISNAIDVRPSRASVDWSYSSLNGTGEARLDNVVWCTRGPYGWLPSTMTGGNSVKYIQCGTTATFSESRVGSPLVILRLADLPQDAAELQSGPLEGMEYNIVDGNPDSAAFGATISGGGANHYKVRYNGSNWIRVG